MWPFKNNKTSNFDSWPIVRSRPIKKTYGRSISLFINNMDCHTATVDVYEDGSIECWGFVDLALFKQKLRANWVVPAPKAGQTLSVFNFGSTAIEDGAWLQSQESIDKEVRSIIEMLNPSMRDLLDMDGSDTELRGKVRYAKLGLSDKKPYRIDPQTYTAILGAQFPVLRLVDGAFELTRLTVYSDGACQLGSSDKLCTIAELEEMYDAGRVVNFAPSRSRIILPGLGSFRTAHDFGAVSPHDRLSEVHDALNVLNGKESVIKACARCFKDYEREPSEQAVGALRLAYDAVPVHLRCYCGDMDTRDTAIRAVLFGE